MRRLYITTEHEQAIELDEDKLSKHMTAVGHMAPATLERRLAKQLESGEQTVDGLAAAFGTRDWYVDRRVEVELQEKCEKHNVWYQLAPKRLAECWQCANERRKQ